MQNNDGEQYLSGFWCGVARGFCAGAPHSLQFGVTCQVIRVILIAVGLSALCLYSRPAPPLPLVSVSMW